LVAIVNEMVLSPAPLDELPVLLPEELHAAVVRANAATDATTVNLASLKTNASQSSSIGMVCQTFGILS